MAKDMLNELFEVVVSACDSLYGNRKLITQKAVLEIIAAQGRWTREYLEENIQEYINDWRLQNLGLKDPMASLQDQLTRFETERTKIINELRDMLGKMGRDHV